MATPDETSAFEELMARAGQGLPAADWSTADDLARMSVEAITAQKIGDVRQLASAGSVRLSGAGVDGHTADLDAVGMVALSWQRAVTAVGASLEGARAAVGRLSESVVERTKLRLMAAPAPGSIVLHVSPGSSPLSETSPGGELRLFDVPRPLADQASEALIDLLAQAAATGADADALEQRITELGPRVATAVKSLADVLGREFMDLDAEWAEPERATRRVSMPSGTAGWLGDFVAGKALDAAEVELAGTARTVSDIAKWSIETSEGLVQVDASAVDAETISNTRVGQRLRLRVLVRITERPDGTTRRSFEALDVAPDEATTDAHDP